MNTFSSPSIGLYNNVDSTKNVQDYNRILIPYFSLYSDRIVIHPKPFQLSNKKRRNTQSLNNLKKDKFKGQISKTQRASIKKKITAWLTSIKINNETQKNKFKRKEHYPVFITLTLSAKQFHSDKEIKRKLLDLFIKKLKSKFGVDKYFWRAESQKNGNIHFHLIVDKYCNYADLRIIWNLVQNKLGYIDKFEQKYNYRNPNSVDVKSVKDVDNFVNYVLKYCAKDSEGRLIDGRVFGMSDKLRNLGVYQNILDSELSDYIIKYKEHNYFKIYQGEFYTVLIFTKDFYNSKFYQLLNSYSRSYYLKVYNYIYNSNSQVLPIKKEFKLKLAEQSTQLELFKLSEQVKINIQYKKINQSANMRYHQL